MFDEKTQKQLVEFFLIDDTKYPGIKIDFNGEQIKIIFKAPYSNYECDVKDKIRQEFANVDDKLKAKIKENLLRTDLALDVFEQMEKTLLPYNKLIGEEWLFQYTVSSIVMELIKEKLNLNMEKAPAKRLGFL